MDPAHEDKLCQDYFDALEAAITRRFRRYRKGAVPASALLHFRRGVRILGVRWEYRDHLSAEEYELLTVPGKPTPAMARHIGGILARSLLAFYPDLTQNPLGDL